MTDEFLIRARLDRFRLSALTDIVLASGMSWADVKTFAVYALGAMERARAGDVPTAQMDIIAADGNTPDAVYQRLCDLVVEAVAAVALPKLPTEGGPH